MHESHLTAERNDLFAHFFHHADQSKRADVRLAHVHDLRRRAGFHEFLHHLAAEVARVLDLAVQFTVGKSTCTAFAKLHIRFRIEDAFPPKSPGIPGSLARPLAAFKHDRPKSHLGQHQRRKNTAGTEADDDGAQRPGRSTIRRRVRNRVIGRIGRRPQVLVAAKFP